MKKTLYVDFSWYPIPKKLKEILKIKGPFHLIKKFFYKYIFFVYLIFSKKTDFEFQKIKYHYFYHPYNITWANERIVEIPIIKRKIDSFQGKEILEVGNVLSHYFSVNWDILDKYERGEDVINKDVVKFKPEKKYDLIVSISTLEHVGWDEIPKNPKKILLAIKNLKENCLKENGEILMTLPINYNLVMDKLLFSGKLVFDEKYYLKRISWDNKWEQSTLEDVRSVKFNSPFIGAQALVVAVIKK